VNGIFANIVFGYGDGRYVKEDAKIMQILSKVSSRPKMSWTDSISEEIIKS
jgi:hypothetical protein